MEQRELFSSLVLRLSKPFSFLGMEDWAVDLKNSRVLGAESEFHDLTASAPPSAEMRVYFGKKSDAAKLRKIFQSVFADLSVSAPRILGKRDWMKAWRRHYKAQNFVEGKRKLAIVPSWKKAPAIPSVRISPGMAFGTGTHPTTQLCLKILLRRGSADLRSVLDFGAGTGVLALAAEKLFQSKSIAVESDLVALDQCRKNARLNRSRRMKFAKRMPKGAFDLVFANVLAPVLLEHRASLHASVKKEGMIILSGLLRTEAKAFLKKFSSKDFRTLEFLEQGDWAAIALRKN